MSLFNGIWKKSEERPYQKEELSQDSKKIAVQTDLIYLLSRTRPQGYGTITVREPVDFGKFMHNMRRDSIHSPNEMSGWIQGAWGYLDPTSRNPPPRHIMLLDCDSVSDRDKACGHLGKQEIRYTEIESSPGHFWVVCDFTGSFCNVIYEAEIIPGVDSNYLKHARGSGFFIFRAYPKYGVLPRFCSTDFMGLPESPYSTWLKEFYKYWHSPEMSEMCQFASEKQPAPEMDFISTPTECGGYSRTRAEQIVNSMEEEP